MEKGRRMATERIVGTTQTICKHEQMVYAERCFDILNGFEFTFNRCINCHKIISLEAKKLKAK
jgi:hypothetical protein